MHSRAGFLKKATFTMEEPSSIIKDKLKRTWGHAVLVYNDEVGAAGPGLYGALSCRAYSGKRAAGQVQDVEAKQAPFGPLEILCCMLTQGTLHSCDQSPKEARA